uniref:FGENESH: predicted gene_15.216 protein n=1 Tax=Rhodotorula toruloides TaxID=5286 RepID=A0A0K3CN66_RHOTO
MYQVPYDGAATPSQPLTVLRDRLDAGFNVRQAVNLELDITDRTLKLEAALPDFPLRGEWRVVVEAEGDTVYFSASFADNLPVGSIGDRVRLNLKVEAVQEDRCILLACYDEHDYDMVLPSEPGDDFILLAVTEGNVSSASNYAKDRWYDPKTHRHYRFTFSLEQKSAWPSYQQPGSRDVRLFFPRVAKEGASLWVEESFLILCSDYFISLLSGGFAEGSRSSKKRRRLTRKSQPPSNAADPKERPYKDPDDELDAQYWSNSVPFPEPDEDDDNREVTITETAWTTYQAVLAYLRTGFIEFAPLSSACKPRNPAAHHTRLDRINETADGPGPGQVSPKSTFRLAHLLELSELEEICLLELSKTLQAQNAAYELFDDASICFDRWRQVIVKFVARNWEEVKETAGWKEMYGRIASGEMPESAPRVPRLPPVFVYAFLFARSPQA